jgi:LPLT family lysophospholipid transporter-like MFS transporter
MLTTLGTQFFSAVSDNALIFAALAIVHRAHYPVWTGPLLQEFFIGTYILLAPWVGALANVQSKGRIMLLSNLVKAAGGLGMCLHFNPFACYAVVGAGAAVYSPAKYGILPELVRGESLVKANSILETATIAAILIGSVMGGTMTDWSIEGATSAITAGYGLAAVAAALIPYRVNAQTGQRFSRRGSLENLAGQIRTLWRSADVRIALLGTSLFWGAGAALRFLVIAWVPEALHINNNRIAGFLTAMVAAGIAGGAVLAAKFVAIHQARRALPAGVLIGAGVLLLPLAHSLPPAFGVMALVGIASGYFIVPLDAILQKRGAESVGAGPAIAIQNLFENVAMLILISGYTAVSYIHVAINDVALGFGIFLAVGMSTLMLQRMPRVHR